MINFVSNLPQDLRSGGFSAINAAAFVALGKSYPVRYIGPIDPPPLAAQKVMSRLRRWAGLRADFSFFSQRRLEAIAREVHARCPADADLHFFQGFTPWILTAPPRPYVALSDCTFRDYMDLFQVRDQFRIEDLERIERTEAAWLAGARKVIFTSDWAARRAIDEYVLDPDRVAVAGTFGELELPARDSYDAGRQFAFLSTNFEAKGGPTVLAAFREVRKRHHDASLVLVGDRPSGMAPEPGIERVGFLRKEHPAEHRRYREILGRARALVHPTRSDVCPLLVVEAGYFGCPVISSRRAAIPELIDDRRTGLLLDDPSQVGAVAGAMNWMLEDEGRYRRMRHAAWEKARGQHSKRLFEERLVACIRGLDSIDRASAS